MMPIRPLRAMAADLARTRRGGAFGERDRVAAAKVVADVRRRGDAAVLRVVRAYDDANTQAADLIADRAMLRRAARGVPADVRSAIDLAHARIRAFHAAQTPRAVERRDANGTVRLVPVPVGRVGALVPRGATAYPSTALMTGVPARVAGVRELVVASPMPKGRAIDPALAYALVLVEAEALYRAGGAAAGAALAFPP